MYRILYTIQLMLKFIDRMKLCVCAEHILVTYYISKGFLCIRSATNSLTSLAQEEADRLMPQATRLRTAFRPESNMLVKVP